MTIKTQAGCKTDALAVVIVRIPPTHPRFPQIAECIQGLVKKGYAPWVFLQGPAVGPWLGNGQADFSWAQNKAVTVRLCQAAWHRHAGAGTEPPYPLSTLIQAWSQIIQAQHLEVFGLGAWPDDWPELELDHPQSAYGLLLTYPPSEADQDSQLEWALSACALELDLAVAFTGAGCQVMETADRQRWAQLQAQHMARLMIEPATDALAGRCWMVL